MRQGLLFSIIVSIIFCAPALAVGGNMGLSTEPLTDGSAGYPYLIEDLADFDEFASNSSYWAEGVHTKLMTDIDLSGRTYTAAVIAPDTSSSEYFQGTEFRGSFDGNGSIVTYLTIDGPNNNYIGLFGKISYGGQISNLGIESCNITGRGYVGSLLGDNYHEGIIINCYSIGTVIGYSKYGYNESLGGLVGANHGALESCYSTGFVIGHGNSETGGLVGDNFSGVILNSYSNATVSGSYTVGGLVGSNYGSYCISMCYSTGQVTGTGDFVGGLIGNNGFGDIISCFWDIDTSSITNGVGSQNPDPVGVMGRTTAEMHTQSTFIDAGWNFANYQIGAHDSWYMPIDDYPLAYWQNSAVAIMPDTTGMTLAETQNTLTNSGFIIGNISYLHSLTTPADVVAGVSARIGGYVDLSKPIDIYVSLGSSGDGSQAHPFEIASQVDLETVNYNLEAHYIITADIYMNCYTTYSTAVIAPDTDNMKGGFQGSPFTGHFDGNGFRVIGLTISAGMLSEYIGLFGQIGPGAEVYNIAIENCDIMGCEYAGALAGYNDGGYITSCYATGNIASLIDYAGGLIGRNLGDIANCYSATTVHGYNYIGGLVGHSDGRVINSYSAGTIEGRDYVGGLVGYNFFDITNCYSTCAVSGNYFVGGIAGYSSGWITGSFWDINTSGIGSSGSNNFGAIGKTTPEMKTLATFTDVSWDFADYQEGCHSGWFMPAENYPLLYWQNPGATAIPDVQGMTFIETQATFTNIGLVIGSIFYVHSLTSPADTVIRVSSRVGSYVNQFSTVDIYISLGSSGDGSQANPYEVASYSDLKAVNEDLSAHYKMTSDIYVDYHVVSAAAVVAPDTNRASNGFQGTPFAGTFDGDGFKIVDLKIRGSKNSSGAQSDFVGLFGLIDSGSEVRNVALENCNIKGNDYVGGLVGCNRVGNITNCYLTGSVSGSGHFCLGGLLGYNDRGSVTQCYSAGSVWSYGNVYSGGLVGQNKQGSIANCYSTGMVRGISGFFLGGLLGSCNGGNVTNCYSSGVLMGQGIMGGLVGNGYGQIINCFWDVNESGIGSSGSNNLGATGKTTAEMQILSTFVGWDFENIWWIDEGNDYPRLRWELNTLPVANAGVDQTVCASLDGYALVYLDGTGSTDADGDALTYFWYNDANELIATGAEPNVVFGVGEYEITLIVNDGITDSEPDSCVVTVVDPFEALAVAVTELVQDAGIANSLLAKVDVALKILEDGNANNDGAAAGSLGALINAVNAQRGKKISEADADVLIAAAQRIIDML